jgi:hypothetical protein
MRSTSFTCRVNVEKSTPPKRQRPPSAQRGRAVGATPAISRTRCSARTALTTKKKTKHQRRKMRPSHTVLSRLILYMTCRDSRTGSPCVRHVQQKAAMLTQRGLTHHKWKVTTTRSLPSNWSISQSCEDRSQQHWDVQSICPPFAMCTRSHTVSHACVLSPNPCTRVQAAAVV